MRQRVSCGEAPSEWHRADGTTVACTEKVKVLNENWQEIRAMLQDAMDDAVLIDHHTQYRSEETPYTYQFDNMLYLMHVAIFISV